jgi:acetyl-CoA acyltransferase
MGEHAEKMAKEAPISREDQDAFAHRSHTRAAAAWKAGIFDQEVMHVVAPPRFDKAFTKDNLVREDGKLESYAALSPAFDRKYGTITAGNSSPLTDGAAALLLMTEDKAKELGMTPLGFIRSWSYAALDPRGWMLMGPTHATPKALERAGLSLGDMDLVEMHEAFAAQVLCNVQAFESKKYAKEKLGLKAAIGELDDERLNVHGGSIAIGHPFAATGARLVTTALHELRRRKGKYALVTACAAGGLGASVVLEAYP